MKIYTPKYPDICPLFQICSNHWYYWYSTHPYSPKHLTPPPLSILRHSHLRLTPSLGHSLPRCSSVPPATVSRAIEDSNLSASQPLAEYSSVASTYRSNLFRPKATHRTLEAKFLHQKMVWNQYFHNLKNKH